MSVELSSLSWVFAHGYDCLSRRKQWDNRHDIEYTHAHTLSLPPHPLILRRASRPDPANLISPPHRRRPATSACGCGTPKMNTAQGRSLSRPLSSRRLFCCLGPCGSAGLREPEAFVKRRMDKWVEWMGWMERGPCCPDNSTACPPRPADETESKHNKSMTAFLWVLKAHHHGSQADEGVKAEDKATACPLLSAPPLPGACWPYGAPHPVAITGQEAALSSLCSQFLGCARSCLFSPPQFSAPCPRCRRLRPDTPLHLTAC